MIGIAVNFAFACLGVALLLALWRVIVAPGIADRVLALDTLFVNAIGLIILYGIVGGTQLYFEAAMIIAMLGFVSTVAYARYMLRGNIIE
jgi:multicomponent K+:H+ antiporter subunit F